MISLKCDKINHKSALLYPKDIEAYLNEERQYGAILGPYKNFPIDQCHSSPFMMREKPNAVHRSVIIDLSWPKGASVNVGIDKNSYLGTDFVLTFPTVDHITSEKKISPGAHLYKIDVSRAFCHVATDPMDLDLLGMSWQGNAFIDTKFPFGSHHGTQIFQRLSDAVRHVSSRIHRHKLR